MSGIDSKVVSCLHFNDASNLSKDECGEIWTATGTPTFDASIKRFGFGSCLFNGSSRLQTPYSADLNLSTNDFTIDCWIYMTKFPTSAYVPICTYGNISISSFGNEGIVITANADGTISGVATASAEYQVNSPTKLILMQWNHIALIRKSNTLSIALNGKLSSWINISSVINCGAGMYFILGYHGFYGYFFTGYMDELRISNGVARWISDFTPPVSEYSKFDCNGEAIKDKLNLLHGYK